MNLYDFCSGSIPRVWWSVAVLTLVVGCSGGDGLQRYDIQGTVKYQGEPVPVGRILFEPDATRGNRGPQGFAVISNGVYDTRKSGGKGAIGGPHTVRIDGFSGTGDGDSPMGRPLFRQYQQSLDLPEENTDFDFVVTNSS